MTGLHSRIQYSFLLVGHTKFSPDGCFGLLKRRFRRTKVSCLDELADVVNQSADINHAQLVGTQSGEVVVPTYDWSSFLSPRFRKLAGIKKLHHIIIKKSPSGTSVHVKQFSDSPERAVSLLKDCSWKPLPSELPQVIQPAGLSPSRQWYLYKEIRPYCTECTKDLTCPLPTVPQNEEEDGEANGENDEEEDNDEEDEEEEEQENPVTSKRRCGVCRQHGHNARTCPLR